MSNQVYSNSARKYAPRPGLTIFQSSAQVTITPGVGALVRWEPSLDQLTLDDIIIEPNYSITFQTAGSYTMNVSVAMSSLSATLTPYLFISDNNVGAAVAYSRLVLDNTGTNNLNVMSLSYSFYAQAGTNLSVNVDNPGATTIVFGDPSTTFLTISQPY